MSIYTYHNKDTIEFFETKLFQYENRTKKQLLDNVLVTAIFLIFLAIGERFAGMVFILSCFIYFLYFTSGVFVVFQINKSNDDSKTNQLKIYFLYNIIDAMQLIILTVCMWLTGISFFKGINDGVQTIRTLSLIFWVVAVVCSLVSPSAFKIKLDLLQVGKLANFIKLTTIPFAVTSFVIFIYITITNNVSFMQLSFIAGLIGFVWSWSILPNIIWNIYEILFWGFRTWFIQSDITENR